MPRGKFSSNCNLYIKNENPCNCPVGRLGLLCEHKYSCGNCDSTKCNKNIQCNADGCKKGWKGIYCITKDCAGLQMCATNGNYLFEKADVTLMKVSVNVFVRLDGLVNIAKNKIVPQVIAKIKVLYFFI